MVGAQAAANPRRARRGPARPRERRGVTVLADSVELNPEPTHLRTCRAAQQSASCTPDVETPVSRVGSSAPSGTKSSTSTSAKPPMRTERRGPSTPNSISATTSVRLSAAPDREAYEPDGEGNYRDDPEQVTGEADPEEDHPRARGRATERPCSSLSGWSNRLSAGVSLLGL